MSTVIIILVMVVFGLVLMGVALFSKKEDIEDSSAHGANDLFGIIFNLVFSFSTVTIKRILLFTLGFLWTGLFLYILLSGEY